MSHHNLAGNLRPTYGADIALLSYPHMVILLLYMAGGGGPPDLKRKNVCHVHNLKFYFRHPLAADETKT